MVKLQSKEGRLGLVLYHEQALAGQDLAPA